MTKKEALGQLLKGNWIWPVMVDQVGKKGKEEVNYKGWGDEEGTNSFGAFESHKLRSD